MKTVQLKICRGRKTQLVISNQVVTIIHAVVWRLSSASFISLLIGRETIYIPEIFSGVHGFKILGLKILHNLHNACTIRDFGRTIRQKLVHNLLKKKTHNPGSPAYGYTDHRLSKNPSRLLEKGLNEVLVAENI